MKANGKDKSYAEISDKQGQFIDRDLYFVVYGLDGTVRALADAQDRSGQIHTSVYRTVALMASLDDAKIKVFRVALTSQLGDVKRRIAKAVDGSAKDDPAVQTALAESAKAIDNHQRQADMAIDLSSVDPNTGIAAMQSADTSFALLSKTLHSMAARVDTLTAESLAASLAHTNRSNLLLGLLALATALGAIALS